MTRPLILALAAALLCGCVVTLDPTGSGVSVQTSAPFPVTSNTVAAATIGTDIVAACAAFGLPIPETAATGGVMLLLGVWAFVRGRRTRKHNKYVVKAGDENNTDVAVKEKNP